MRMRNNRIDQTISRVVTVKAIPAWSSGVVVNDRGPSVNVAMTEQESSGQREGGPFGSHECKMDGAQIA